MIEETSQASATRGAMLADGQLAGYLREHGIRWRIADRDAVDSMGRVPADLAPYLRRARGKTLPYMLLVDPSGRLKREGPLPGTAAELLSVMRTLGN